MMGEKPFKLGFTAKTVAIIIAFVSPLLDKRGRVREKESTVTVTKCQENEGISFCMAPPLFHSFLQKGIS